MGGWLLRVAWERASALAAAVLVAVYVLPFELTGVAVLVGWAALGVGAIGLDRRGLPQHRPLRADGAAPGARATAALEWAVWYAGAVAFIAALEHALVVELPFDELFGTTLPAIPFVDAGGLAIVVLTISALAIGVLDGRSAVRATCGLLATSIVAYGVIFELPVDAVVIVWSGLAVVCAAIAADRGRWAAWWLAASDSLLVLGASAVLLGLAPLSRLVVDADRASDVIPFLNGATIAIGALVAALLASARLLPNQRWTPIRVGAAAVAVVYLLSVGVVDLFQARLGGAVDEEELAKQAQVALSALWGVLGATAFGIGLVADRPRARQAGLVLLGLVTVKVLLVDLAALDVAYRVLSLLAPGDRPAGERLPVAAFPTVAIASLSRPQTLRSRSGAGSAVRWYSPPRCVASSPSSSSSSVCSRSPSTSGRVSSCPPSATRARDRGSSRRSSVSTSRAVSGSSTRRFRSTARRPTPPRWPRSATSSSGA